MKSDKFLSELINRGIDEGCFPSAVAAIGRGREVLSAVCAGRIYLPDGPEPDEHTLYDMASLTKLMSATTIALKAVDSGKIRLGDRLSAFCDAPTDKADITIEMIMTHTAGFAPSFHLEDECEAPEDAAFAILRHPLAQKPGDAPLYSCTGFILLGKILENLYGAPLDALARDMVFAPLGMVGTGYCPIRGVFAHQEAGRPVGVVHDENARFLRGVSGNAGVFSNIVDMTKFAAMLSLHGNGFISRELFDAAILNRTPGFDAHRGWGFHIAGTPQNFMGTKFPADSFGHTGFTGTSLAVDPHSGLYAVLLTNRIHPSRENQKLFPFRRAFHDAVFERYA